MEFCVALRGHYFRRFQNCIVHTVGFHKSLRGPSVWSKITLITGHVGGAGACPPTCKMEKFFHISLALTMPMNNIKNNFYFNNQSLRVSPEAPFNWNLLLIGILSAKGI